MARFKIDEVAEKLKITAEEVVEKLKEKGYEDIDVNKSIDDKAVELLGLDPKKLQMDKRQEFLKKALERRKRHPKPKEVVVKDQAGQKERKRLSKEELLKKKLELEKSLKKVDELRRKKQEEIKAETVTKVVKKGEVAAEKEKIKEEKKVAQKVTPAAEVVDKSIKREISEEKPYKVKEDVDRDTRKYIQTEEAKPDKGVVREEKKEDKRGKKPYRPRKPEDVRGKKVYKKEEIVKEAVKKEEKRIVPDIEVDTEKEALKKKKKDKDEILEVKEVKKPKGKKGVKKVKNFKKDILEGIDELELEEEIEKVEDTFVGEDIVTEEEQVVDKKEVVEEKKEEQPRKPVKPSKIQIGESVSITELARLMGIKANEIVKKLFEMGVMANITQSIDAETAQLLGAEYDIEVEVKTVTEEDLIPKYEDKPEDLKPRPPIITVMGHVDHGKTSLLDKIRKTKVAEKEAGGITQHIGAYEVDLPQGKLVFLDTPGHEAFTTLRARGAQVTDIVILVVAADDGVMPQTKEAIDHSKAANVPIVVAINKIDKPNANPEHVKGQLAELGIISDEWGGDYQFQEVSAKTGQGIDELLERVWLEAEMLELKANPKRPAECVIIESKLDKHRGPVATVIVQNGTLKKGDVFVVGAQYGKVRSMFNFLGKTVKEAGPSIPVELMGFSEVPDAGERLIVLPNEKLAKQIAEMRKEKKREQELLEKSKVSLTDIFSKIQEGELQELNIIIKADVQGSVEALKSSLLKLSNPEVKVNVIHDGVGAISESDVLLASASNAIIIGFNVRPDSKAKAASEREKVEIHLYSVIYDAIEDVKKAIEGMLTPETKENIVGKVEIRKVFTISKVGRVAGCYVLEGKVTRNSNVRILRDNVVIYDGKIGTLKRFQDDVKEVVAGYECGLTIDRYNDIKEGDILEVYELVEEKRTLDDVKGENNEK
ncbi:translation initiation factor IF-2 [Deferribacter autotrophicus]|uniref:Translation initiation factor IF-2 n=1 Tax=Deferribacter autotrophicus TaxID=500465 RepID=A0A5A8F5S5_9BACT|nr:translation initiation factor IF-2 [Deferribacter autotrophicus]KAA0258064.1 translation initiation factor IF-2 [Deferribacter autotrophicus]